MSERILVVDDEQAISILLEFNLKLEGFEVLCVHNGEDVFEAVQSFRPHLLVLDLMLPGIDGIQVCQKLRKEGNSVPVIMLTALQDLSDRIAGLDNGADDYMAKPFSPQELVSRIRAILRRTSQKPAVESDDEDLTIGELVVSPVRREVSFKGELLELTPKEFELLHYLCKHKGRALSRQHLLQNVWDYHFIGDTRIVDVHISHLRDKLESNPRKPSYIQTIRSIGYKISAPRPASSDHSYGSKETG